VAFWKTILTDLWKVEKTLTDGVSFTPEISELCDILNRKLDETPKEPWSSVISHPGGFYRELHRRRLSIA